ncbi:MAG: ArsA family ATPase [Vicinamibacterales bacterium]
MTAPSLLARQFIVVTGKGGVGKSVVAAALARMAANQGRRVLILEADPRESQHELAGVAPSGGDYVVAPGSLVVQNIQPRRVFEAVVREHLHFELLVRRVIKSPIFEHFVDAAPGLKELGVLGHALRVLRGLEPTPLGTIDLVVLDAPATGHGVSMLAAPRLASEVIEGGPIAHLAGHLAAFVADPSATGVVVVTQAEEMVVQETMELRGALLDHVGREPDLLVINGLFPRDEPLDEAPSPTRSSAAVLWHERRRSHDRQLSRIAEQWTGPSVHLPLVPCDRGPRLLERIVGYLLPQWPALEA